MDWSGLSTSRLSCCCCSFHHCCSCSWVRPTTASGRIISVSGSMIEIDKRWQPRKRRVNSAMRLAISCAVSFVCSWVSSSLPSVFSNPCPITCVIATNASKASRVRSSNFCLSGNCLCGLDAKSGTSSGLCWFSSVSIVSSNTMACSTLILLPTATTPPLNGLAKLGTFSHITISGSINQDRPLYMYSTEHTFGPFHETMLLVRTWDE